MGKLRGFFSKNQKIKNQKINVLVMTILIVVAELSRFAKLETVYPLLMIIVTILGGIPIILRAFSALRYRVISIELLVAVAIIGAAIIGGYTEGAIVVWLFNLGDVLEALTLRKTRAAVKSLTEMAPQTAEVIDSVDDEVQQKS